MRDLVDLLTAKGLLATAKLTRRGLTRLTRRSIGAELYLQEAGVDVERLRRASC